VKLLRVRAPRVARRQRPGQFVIVRLHDRGERIPLTIAAADARDETITLVVQGVGKTTRELNGLPAGASLRDVAGPLGRPSEIADYGCCVVVGGGVGTAIAWPVARALKAAGNRVVAIVGARTRELLLLEDEMREASDSLHVMTDDGSRGERGLVTARLAGLYAAGERPGLVLAIGPVPMMRAVAETTRPFGTRTVVSLNPIMVDGTGMCGGCRVVVGGVSRFACVDGPEFDAHAVDFELLARRNAAYRDAERRSLERWRQASEAAP
jgi:ferredoxin--NADP+ reductase